MRNCNSYVMSRRTTVREVSDQKPEAIYGVIGRWPKQFNTKEYLDSVRPALVQSRIRESKSKRDRSARAAELIKAPPRDVLPFGPDSIAGNMASLVRSQAEAISLRIGRMGGMCRVYVDASWSDGAHHKAAAGFLIVHKGGVVEVSAPIRYNSRGHMNELHATALAITVASMCGFSYVRAFNDSTSCVRMWNHGGMPKACPHVTLNWSRGDMIERADELAYNCMRSGEGVIARIPAVRVI